MVFTLHQFYVCIMHLAIELPKKQGDQMSQTAQRLISILGNDETLVRKVQAIQSREDAQALLDENGVTLDEIQQGISEIRKLSESELADISGGVHSSTGVRGGTPVGAPDAHSFTGIRSGIRSSTSTGVRGGTPVGHSSSGVRGTIDPADQEFEGVDITDPLGSTIYVAEQLVDMLDK